VFPAQPEPMMMTLCIVVLANFYANKPIPL